MELKFGKLHIWNLKQGFKFVKIEAKIQIWKIKAKIQIWKLRQIQIWKIKAKIQIWKLKQRVKFEN
jgi:hypothetical protein